MSDFHDEFCFFSNGDKLRRRDVATHRMLPAQQCLCSRNLKRSVHLGLIHKTELLVLKRVAKVGFQSGALCDTCLQLWIEEAESIAPERLGAIHGDVCARQEFIDRGGSLGVHGNANAG